MNVIGLAIAAGTVAAIALRGSDESSPLSRSVPHGEWTFVNASIEAACGDPRGTYQLVTSGDGEPRPVRLSDELPTSSAIPKYRPTTAGQIQLRAHPLAEYPLHLPAEDQAMVDAGALEGFARGFVDPDDPGGYQIAVYEFPSVRAARTGIALAYRVLVCEGGLQPLSIPQRPEILATTTEVIAGNTHAWWLNGSRVTVVEFGMWHDHQDDLREALTVIGSTWEWPARPASPSID